MKCMKPRPLSSRTLYIQFATVVYSWEGVLFMRMVALECAASIHMRNSYVTAMCELSLL